MIEVLRSLAVPEAKSKSMVAEIKFKAVDFEYLLVVSE
jgi:hypothetical protein